MASNLLAMASNTLLNPYLPLMVDESPPQVKTVRHGFTLQHAGPCCLRLHQLQILGERLCPMATLSCSLEQ